MTSLPPELLSLIAATRGFLPAEEGAALYELCHRAPASRSQPIVEIGSYCGRSTLYMGHAAKEMNATVLAVDHHYGSEENYPPFPYLDATIISPLTSRIDTLEAFRGTIRLAGLEPWVVAVIGNSPTVAQATRVRAAMIFIDGGHGGLPCWMDYISWTPQIVEGGILAIHDVFEDPSDGGRPPYEIYLAARHSGDFEEIARVGSLAAFRRVRGISR